MRRHYSRYRRGLFFPFSLLLCLMAFSRCHAQNNDLPAGTKEIAEAIAGQSVDVVPATVSTNIISQKEQVKLDKEFLYDSRQKSIILSPFINTGKREDMNPAYNLDSLTKQEKIYKYFGIATDLYNRGKTEEAIEILEYIVRIHPDDRYVKEYLHGVKKDYSRQDKKWHKNIKKEADYFKTLRVKALLSEGKKHYKNRNYDMALLNFSDIAALDPNNGTAKKYLKKLEDHYLQEIKVDNIVHAWNSENTPENAVRPTRKVSKATISKAQSLMDENEMDQIVLGKRAESLMEEAELDLRVDNIISSEKKKIEKSEDFTLGSGDSIRISVRDHPELSGMSRVGLKGQLILPLTNDIVQAEGLTVEELKVVLTDQMKRYVKDPYVNATVQEYQSKVFYVIDETGATPYHITRANFTLRDALFTADWGSNRALGRVMVIKPSKLNPIIRKVDAFDLIYRGRLANNIRIENGDVIYVPMTAASKVAQTITDSLAPVGATIRARNAWLDGRWNMDDGWSNLIRIPRNRDLQTDYRSVRAEGNL